MGPSLTVVVFLLVEAEVPSGRSVEEVRTESSTGQEKED
jgi:hypothetical protein